MFLSAWFYRWVPGLFRHQLNQACFHKTIIKKNQKLDGEREPLEIEGGGEGQGKAKEKWQEGNVWLAICFHDAQKHPSNDINPI